MRVRDERVLDVYPSSPKTWVYDPVDRFEVELPGFGYDRELVRSPGGMLFPAPWQTDVDYLPVWGS